MAMDKQRARIDELFAQGGLGRHETFTPRYGWLKKGFDAVARDPNVFKKDEAIVELGVGKNMVRSIRSWCLAFKLVKSDGGNIVQTDFGKSLLSSNGGWDPYLEDDASLWLLHWQLFIPPFEAVSWPLAFNYCNLLSFDSRELSKIIYNAGQTYPSLARISPKTYQRDASCIIKMYVDPENKDLEIECPFMQLGLMHKAEGKNQVSFNTAFKPTLPPSIFAAACFSYAMHYLPKGQKTVSLQQLVFGINSPGVAYKLPETEAGQYLNDASKSMKGFRLVDVLGNMQLHFDEPPKQLCLKALKKFYRER